MEQKKLFIGLALVVAVLALGVAYAAITTQTLNVVGNVAASASNENFDVHFTSTVGQEKTYTGSVDGHSNGATVTATAAGRTGSFDIRGLTTKGDKVTLTYNIENASPDLGATLSSVNIDGANTETNKWYDVDAVLSTQTLTNDNGTASNKATLTITVELLDTPANDTEAPVASYYVEFTADPA